MFDPERQKPFQDPDFIHHYEHVYQTVFNSFFSPILETLPSILFQNSADIPKIRKVYEDDSKKMEQFFIEKTKINLEFFCNSFTVASYNILPLKTCILVDSWYSHLILLAEKKVKAKEILEDDFEIFKLNLEYFICSLNLIEHTTAKRLFLNCLEEKKSVVDLIMREVGTQHNLKEKFKKDQALTSTSNIGDGPSVPKQLDLNEIFRRKIKDMFKGGDDELVEAATSQSAIRFAGLFAKQFSELYFWGEDVDHFVESMNFLMDTFIEQKIKTKVLIQILSPIELRLGVSLVKLQDKKLRPFSDSLVKYLFLVGLVMAYEQKVIAFQKLGFDRTSGSLGMLDEAVQDFRATFYSTEIVIDNITRMFNQYRSDSDLKTILSKLNNLS